jgi:hypothetical protein
MPRVRGFNALDPRTSVHRIPPRGCEAAVLDKVVRDSRECIRLVAIGQGGEGFPILSKVGASGDPGAVHVGCEGWAIAPSNDFPHCCWLRRIDRVPPMISALRCRGTSRSERPNGLSCMRGTDCHDGSRSVWLATVVRAGGALMTCATGRPRHVCCPRRRGTHAMRRIAPALTTHNACRLFESFSHRGFSTPPSDRIEVVNSPTRTIRNA